MIVPLPKIKAILLYFANNTNPKYLGKVKLMKLIYYLDFIHLKKYGRPVTYDKYVNLKLGPIPQTIKNLVDDESDNYSHNLKDTISFQKTPTSKGTMDKVIAKRKFLTNDRNMFSNTELNILEEVSKRFYDYDMKKIVDASHKENVWKKTNELQDIPYTLAAKDNDSKFSEEEISILLQL